MKLFIKVLLMLSIISTSDIFAQEGSLLQVIDMNGDTLLLNTKEIQNIVFENNTNTSRLIVFNIDSEPFNCGIHQISQIYFIDSTKQMILIYYHPLKAYENYVQEIDSIDNIKIYNTNQYRDHIYKNIELEINGLNFEYRRTHRSRSNSGNSNEVKEFRTRIVLGNTFYLGYALDCHSYAFIHPRGDLDFTNESLSIDDIKRCARQRLYLFFDKDNNVIDSLKYVFTQDEETTNIGYRSETDISEYINFYNIPFEINENGEIIVDIEMNENINFGYAYSSDNITGNSAYYSTSTLDFTKIDSYDEDAKLTIKISP